MRLIELCGPPAVGKTTLLEALPPFPSVFIPRGARLRHLEWFPEIQPPTPRWWRMTLKSDAQRRVVAAISAGWAVEIKGLLQWGLSLAPLVDEPMIRAYFERVPLPAAIIVCLAPHDVIQERSRGRDKTDRSDELPKWFAAAEIMLATLDKRDAPYTVLDMKEPVETNVKRILETID